MNKNKSKTNQLNSVLNYTAICDFCGTKKRGRWSCKCTEGNTDSIVQGNVHQCLRVINRDCTCMDIHKHECTQ